MLLCSRARALSNGDEFPERAPEIGVHQAFASDQPDSEPTPVFNDPSDWLESQDPISSELADPCADDCFPKAYFEAGAIALWRDNNATSRSTYDPASVDFSGGVGVQLLVGVRQDVHNSWEVAYFNVTNMNGSAVWHDSPPVHLSFDTPGFNAADDQWAQYSSDLYNVELAYLHTWNRLSLLGGFRYLRLSENYETGSKRRGVSYEAFQGGSGTHTDNDLVGGQIGARWRQDYRRFFYECTGKAGVYGNHANQSSSFFAIDGTGNFTESYPTTYDCTTSFIGDLNFAAGFQLTKRWGISAGYNLIWIDRVALAPDQFIGFFNSPQHTKTDGSVFLQAINICLERNW